MLQQPRKLPHYLFLQSIDLFAPYEPRVLAKAASSCAWACSSTSFWTLVHAPPVGTSCHITGAEVNPVHLPDGSSATGCVILASVRRTQSLPSSGPYSAVTVCPGACCMDSWNQVVRAPVVSSPLDFKLPDDKASV